MCPKPQSVSAEWLAFIRHKVKRPSHPVGLLHWFTGAVLLVTVVCPVYRKYATAHLAITAGRSNRRFRWPGDCAAAAVSEVGNVAGARGGNAGFDRRIWLFAGPDTVKKVLHVVDGAVAKAFGLHDGILSS